MDFKNIPKKYRPIPFWSWNEKLDPEETKEQIRIMDSVGIGGFFMHARGGLQTEYMKDEWFSNVDAAVSEAKNSVCVRGHMTRTAGRADSVTVP